MDVDLDIDNYDLEDILRLFKLDYNFDENDLRNARKSALKSHPDKSKLDMKYFLFFSKAYNIIYDIYQFRQKKFQNASNKKYLKEEMSESNKYELKKKLSKFKNAKDFNVWFNRVFNDVKLKNKEMDSGYGDWFKSEEDINKDEAKNLSEFGEIFERKKKHCSSIVKYNGIQDMVNSNGSNLLNEKPDYYASDVFSKLKYEDLKKAHTETVVPVTDKDINWSEKLKTLEQRQKERENIEVSSLSQSKKYLEKRKEKENIVSMSRAYNLYKRDEEILNSNNKFWSHLKQLGN